MSTIRSKCTIGVAILAALFGCQDAGQHVLAPATTGIREFGGPPRMLLKDGRAVLRQSAKAPKLETYQVSFWAKPGKETDIRVNYVPVGDEKPRAFLRFRIKKHALEALQSLESAANGVALEAQDSVYMTLTIDPVNYAVSFEPSGVMFSLNQPAELTLSYTYADRDVNGDGVIDSTDAYLMNNLSLYSIAETDRRLKTQQGVQGVQEITATVTLSSIYAVSW